MDTSERSLATAGPPDQHDAGPVRIMLIEDDPGDALLVQEYLNDSGDRFDITWARTLAEAIEQLTPDLRCVLLDLGLPDSQGLGGLRRVLEASPRASVLVLTGLDDDRRGAEAMAAGAADYLSKAAVDGPLLARAIRYAQERRRADDAQRQLLGAALRREENARLERGLLPVPIVDDPAIAVQTCYRPGRDQGLIGGDFYDVVESEDGTIRAMVGDVCGHGPDEAALGACLRIAWRALVMAGRPPLEVLTTLDRVLVSERSSIEIFATMCMVTISADRQTAELFMAGHPAPLLWTSTWSSLPSFPRDTALGIAPDRSWPSVAIQLGKCWRLLLFTDGLIEGRVPGQVARLGSDGLLDELGKLEIAPYHPRALGDTLLARVEELNGGALSDDVAMLFISHT